METAIVLGVIGIIMAAIWAIWGPIREKIRQDEAVRQITTIVNNTRLYYQNRPNIPTDAKGNFDNLTHELARAGVIPPDMIRNRSAAILRIDHPWNRAFTGGSALAAGGLAVCNNVNDTFCPNTAGPWDSSGLTFLVQLRAVSPEACIALPIRLSQTTGPKGLVGVEINGVGLTLPVTVNDATNACRSFIGGLSYNIINYVYRLRQNL